MDYQTLPKEERIARASEYALMLVADDLAVEEIVVELSTMFNLAHEEARQAYEKMRQDHAATYKKTINKKNIAALAAGVTSLIFALTYFFMGKEMSGKGIGTAMILLSILFALPALNSVIIIISNWIEKNRKQVAKPHLPRYLGSKGDKFKVYLFVSISFASIFIIWPIYSYVSGEGTIDETRLETSAPKILHKKPWKSYISDNDNRFYVYYFSFLKDPNIYRFDEEYVKYRMATYDIDSLEPGDVLTIRYRRDHEMSPHQQDTGKIFTIFNIAKKGLPYADLAARNMAVNKENKKNIGNFIMIFAVMGGLFLTYRQFRARKYKRIMAERMANTTDLTLR
ncbi:hypothetical protein [Paraflavitalea sp. CAU 1676]|uniref:hypothetical protein n=1 Tax=Paraflavitalea sp. CAU 1676 TaxID=3032598 RepID=UPI0023D98411|nr:hypothetical protein [Paraflavitalea sp. CAU 1676]MDF2187273.1 hypothetical protein [Paraflavitalea sp. CAU 1676]